MCACVTDCADQRGGRVSPNTSIDRMAVNVKLKDVVATVAINEELRCMARAKDVVMTMLLPTRSPAACVRVVLAAGKNCHVAR